MEEKIKPSPTYKAELKEAYNKASKPLLWVGIISIVMLFAGLTSAYVVRADNGNWLLFNLPNAFYLSTAVIVTSSITLFFALQMVEVKTLNSKTFFHEYFFEQNHLVQFL